MSTPPTDRLIRHFLKEGYAIHGALGSNEYPSPPKIPNHGFGDGRERVPAVIAHDPLNNRVVFGIGRPDRKSLDTEESLTDYNVYLDHNALRGKHASVLCVLIPAEHLAAFTDIITHYIHREYWERIRAVVDEGINEE